MEGTRRHEPDLKRKRSWKRRKRKKRKRKWRREKVRNRKRRAQEGMNPTRAWA